MAWYRRSTCDDILRSTYHRIIKVGYWRKPYLHHNPASWGTTNGYVEINSSFCHFGDCVGVVLGCRTLPAKRNDQPTGGVLVGVTHWGLLCVCAGAPSESDSSRGFNQWTLRLILRRFITLIPCTVNPSFLFFQIILVTPSCYAYTIFDSNNPHHFTTFKDIIHSPIISACSGGGESIVAKSDSPGVTAQMWSAPRGLLIAVPARLNGRRVLLFW